MPPCKDSGTNFKQAKCGLGARSTHHGAIFLKFESEKIGICLKKIEITLQRPGKENTHYLFNRCLELNNSDM